MGTFIWKFDHKIWCIATLLFFEVIFCWSPVISCHILSTIQHNVSDNLFVLSRSVGYDPHQVFRRICTVRQCIFLQFQISLGGFSLLFELWSFQFPEQVGQTLFQSLKTQVNKDEVIGSQPILNLSTSGNYTLSNFGVWSCHEGFSLSSDTVCTSNFFEGSTKIIWKGTLGTKYLILPSLRNRLMDKPNRPWRSFDWKVPVRTVPYISFSIMNTSSESLHH